MISNNQKDVLLEATIELFKETEHPEKVTSRQIASRAGVNLAMINYYFGSKDELTSQALSAIFTIPIDKLQALRNPAEAPKERLKNFLIYISQIVIRYKRYTKLYIPHLLLEADISQPQLILPEIREHFGLEKSEEQCRLIAYQLISFLQLIFYRSDAFMLYSGININLENEAERLINTELNLLLPDSIVEE